MKNQYITQRNKNSDRYVLSCARYVYKQSYVDTHPERIPRICYKKEAPFYKSFEWLQSTEEGPKIYIPKRIT